MEKNEDLTYRVYTQKAEADKAINSLKGILEGISLDNVINDTELIELGNWCAIHQELINRNPFQDFMLNIQNAINGIEPAKEIVEDLKWVMKNLKFDDDGAYYNKMTNDLQVLQGICHGILADGLINDTEIIELKKWMGDNQHLASYYPYDELYTVIMEILKDGIVDESEKILLKAYFNQFVRLTDDLLTEKIAEETKTTKITGLCAISPSISMEGNSFCITGKLTRASRSQLVTVIEDGGGVLHANPKLDTNFLIVGDNGNPAWAFACYGRKVERAISMRKKGHHIVLVHEYDLWDYLDDLQTTL